MHLVDVTEAMSNRATYSNTKSSTDLCPSPSTCTT